MNISGTGVPPASACSNERTDRPADAVDFLTMILQGRNGMGLESSLTHWSGQSESAASLPATGVAALAPPLADELYPCHWRASGHLSYVAHATGGRGSEAPSDAVIEEQGPEVPSAFEMPPRGGGYSSAAAYPKERPAGEGAPDSKIEGADQAPSVAGGNEALELPETWQRRRLTVLKGKQSVRLYLRDYAASEEALRLSAQAVVASLQLPADIAVTVIANGQDIAAGRKEES